MNVNYITLRRTQVSCNNVKVAECLLQQKWKTSTIISNKDTQVHNNITQVPTPCLAQAERKLPVEYSVRYLRASPQFVAGSDGRAARLHKRNNVAPGPARGPPSLSDSVPSCNASTGIVSQARSGGQAMMLPKPGGSITNRTDRKLWAGWNQIQNPFLQRSTHRRTES